MRFLRRSLVGLFLLSLTVGLLAWAGNTFVGAVQKRAEQESRVRPARERVFAVNVMQAQPQTLLPVLTSFGEVRSRRTLDLRATAGGMVVELADGFEEGGSVSQGQLLARIDPSDAQTGLALSRTDLQEAESGLRDALRGLELANDELTSAQDQVRLREQALARQRDLASRGVGTEAAVETAQLSVSSAKQAVLSRRQSLANAQARVDQAKTTLSRRQINLDEARRALQETEIFAGFSGTLADVNVVQGGLVTNNERLASIVDAQALEVAFRVSTSQYARLLDGDGDLLLADVNISLDIFGVDLATKGRITRESAVVGDGQTGRLLFARINVAKGFRPGDFVTVKITEPPLDQVILLPAAAIDARPSVLVLGGGDRLEALDVKLLRRQGDDVIVRAPDLAGREIISERSALLGAGIKVRPIRRGDGGGGDATTTPEKPAAALIALTPERRARLVAFVKGNKRMPAGAKERILDQLTQEKVPQSVVERIENRIGG